MRPFALALWGLLACEAPTGKLAHEAPASVTHAVPESDLPVVTLRREASERLAVQRVEVQAMHAPATRLVGGEVIVPPGRTLSVSAPVGGELREAAIALVPGTKVARGDALYRLLPFAPADRDLQARATREVSAAEAQLQAAEARVQRLSQLGADKVVAKRAFEDAIAARDTLRADVQVARSRSTAVRTAPLLSDVALTLRAPNAGVIRTLSVPPGQAVAGGAVLLELVQVDSLQVRVPVYAGDLTQLDPGAGAQVRALTARSDESVSAALVAGPPTSMPDRATVDRYYALSSSSFVPGQRVLVELALRGEQDARSVPRAAVVYDASGAAWVYACDGELRYRRQRIDPIRLAGDHVVFSRGPALASCVAGVGAAEIFGSEFEPGH